MLIEEHEALEMVERYRNDFITAVLGAWDEYMTDIPAAMQAKFDPTTRANVVHALIRHRFNELVDKHDLMRIPNTGKMLLVVIHDAVAMKVKKLNDALISSNVRTQQARSFRCHQTLQIPGIKEAGHLELGYELDAFDRTIKTIWLLCPNGLNRNYWAAPIWGDEVAAGNIVDMWPSALPSEPYKKFSAKVSDYEQEPDIEEGEQ